MAQESIEEPGPRQQRNSIQQITASTMAEYGEPQRDVSMTDVATQAGAGMTELQQQQQQQNSDQSNADTLGRKLSMGHRKSSIILSEDSTVKSLTNNKADDIMMDEPSDIGQTPIYNQQQQPVLIPTVFKWTEGGEKVFVMGTFTGWRKMIALNGPNPKDGSFQVQIALPPGTHRFKFVVDNEVRCSSFIPTATDHSGHFVNYLEIFPTEHDFNRDPNNKSRASLRTMDSKLGLTKDDDDMGDGYTRYYDEQEGGEGNMGPEYTTDIPAIFTDPKVMEEYYLTLDNNERKGNYSQQWLIPPQLPPHLENVILNSYNSNDKANTGGALNIPNHVVLNHLATTSIKHNTLAVASVVRYKRKYVTQILYAPLQ